MRVTRKLERIGPNQELSILAQSVEGLPAIEGSAAADAGEDYVCPACGEPLVIGIHEGELYDITFLCSKCGTLSGGPALPAGVSLPWGKTVVVDPGQYRISETLRLGRGAIVAGKTAVERRLRETGSPVAVAEGRELTADLLDEMVDDVKVLLGSDYGAVRASYERGKKSRTPPREPHRLMELVDRAEQTAASIRAGTPKLDAVATVELDAALGAVRRWRNDPAWPSIVKPLSGEGHQYRHAVIALAAASFLTDAGNAVELAREPGDRRMADIRVRYGADLYGRVEVKAPGALARPAKEIKSEAAFKIVDKAVSSAMGQLADSHPSLLVVGGFNLRRADIEALEAAAHRAIRSREGRRANLAGVGVLSLGALIEGRQRRGGAHPQPRLKATIDARIAPNPDYAERISTAPVGESGELVPLEPGAEEIELALSPDRTVAALVSTVPEPAPSLRKVGRNEPCWCGSGKKFKRCHGA